MNEEIVKKSDEVMLSMLDQMASKDDKSDEQMAALVNNFTKLTGVREAELEHDKLKLERERFELDKRKFEKALEQDKLNAKNGRLDTVVKAGIAGGALAFRVWLSSCLMHYDGTGKVIGTFLGKQTFGKWIDREEKF